MLAIKENVSLKLYSTMRLGGNARYVCDVTNEEEVLEALAFADKHGLPVRTIGHGSNIIWKDEGFTGIVIVMKIDEYEMLPHDIVRFGAGMNWDEAVAVSVSHGLTGLEYLSAIPGTVGATPVQNVGAYGQEVKNVINELRVYDRHSKKFTKLHNEDCRFAYRSSRFKTEDSGRFIITSVYFQLKKGNPKPPFYESLQQYLDDNQIKSYTPEIIRNAVTAIRWEKLPNPTKIANNGSFFANPVIDKDRFADIIKMHPSIKHWSQQDGSVKVSAAWLIENAGFFDYHDQATGMATWHKQCLVIVNEHARHTSSLEEFVNRIKRNVYDMYGIELQQEPELLP